MPRPSVPVRPLLRSWFVDDLQLRTRTSTGAVGSARTYVLIHGIGMSHRYLMRLHGGLAASGATVHTLDLPGFGGLPKPGHDLDAGDMADALGTVLDRLDVGAAVLVGQSMGTQWAAELAARRPDLAAAVVLIGPVSDERHRSFAGQAVALAVDTLRESPGANLLVFTDYLRCGIPWYLVQLRHMLTYRLEETVSRIEAPVLVLRGGRDPIAGVAWSRRLRDRARRGSLVSVPGHAHNAQHSAPRAVAGAIEAFAAAQSAMATT
nr:alpha/beta hydrolase [Microbacterium lemovicicum]